MSPVGSDETVPMDLLDIARREILEEMASDDNLVTTDSDGMLIHE